MPYGHSKAVGMAKMCIAAALLSAMTYAVRAENVYAVPFFDDGVSLRDELILPATITGRVSSASSASKPHVVEFQVDRVYGTKSIAIYTNTGTGAVFHAELLMGEGLKEDISSSKNLPFSASITYTLFISAATYKEGASYAVRIGLDDKLDVAFDGNGGTASETNRTYTLGSPYGLFPKATRSGHELTGWSTAATNGVLLSTNTLACAGYRTLYAQWKNAQISPSTPTNEVPAVTNYYVAFNANGGTGTMSNQTFTVDVGQSLHSNEFTRAGYDFRGWSASAAGSVAYEDGATVTNLSSAGTTKTLYASWMISSASILTQEIDGVIWHYTATSNGVATIQNVSNGAYVAAVDTSLKGTLHIPGTLGTNRVEAIGERAFDGCASVTNIVIPFGVTSIGSYAFAGCINLSPGITIPESVDTMGAYAFTNCHALKIVRYQGDCPAADEALYAGAPRNLISGVLGVRDGWEREEVDMVVQTTGTTDEIGESDSDDESDSGDEGEETVASSGGAYLSWPEGDYERRVFRWVTQPVCKVLFWEIPGVNKSLDVQYYIPGRYVGALPDKDPERDGYTFLGWFTKPYGGTEVTEAEAGKMVVEKSFSLYAHWQKDGEPETLAEVEYDFGKAHVYNGYLTDGDSVVGTIQLKTSKGKLNKTDEETNVTATAAIVLLGEGSIRLKGALDEGLSGTLIPTKSSDERELEVKLADEGGAMEGTFGDYSITGTRHIFGKSTYIDRVKALTAENSLKGYYTVVLKAESDESSLGNGYVGLSVQVKSGGKARVVGTMPDGTKASFNGTLCVMDDETCVLPVVIPLHSGRKGGFGFLMSFADDAVTVVSASSWVNNAIPFSSTLSAEGAGSVSSIAASSSFSIDGTFDVGGVEVDEGLLPDDVEVTASGSKWSVPRADNVKFVSDDGAYEVLTEYGNPAGLSLSATQSKGVFKGRFKVFGVTAEGKSRKYTAVVNGVVLDGVGYGTATVKKVGAVPVIVQGAQ